MEIIFGLTWIAGFMASVWFLVEYWSARHAQKRVSVPVLRCAQVLGGEAGHAGARVMIEGVIDGPRERSPLSGVECALWSVTVIHEQYDTIEGSRWRAVDLEQVSPEEIVVRDQTGSCRVRLGSAGRAGREMFGGRVKVRDQAPGSRVDVHGEETFSGALDDDGARRLEEMFGWTMPRDGTVLVRETVIRPGVGLTVSGELHEDGENGLVLGKPSGRALLLQTGTAEAGQREAMDRAAVARQRLVFALTGWTIAFLLLVASAVVG